MKSAKYILLTLLAVIALSSCDKEEDTIALIRVLDSEGAVVDGALVRLFPEPSTEQPNELIDEVERTTDAAGEALFDFSDYYEQGQAGFAVLNVEVLQDTLMAEGIINILPEQVNEQVLILQ